MNPTSQITCRIENRTTYLQSYNVENRQPPHEVRGMSGISLMDGETCETPGDPLKVWGFVYDGDGRGLCTPERSERGVKVKQVVTEGESVLTTYYYAGGSYEVQVGGEDDVVRQYYSIAGTTVAMKVGAYGDTPAEWSWFLTDHLGSVVGVTDASGVLTAETRYLPFGEVRTDVGIAVTQTDFGYTFQRMVTGSGLMDYKARAYDPWLGRFVQPDTIIPGAGNPQSYNRYGYVKNNPLNSIDPTGHTDCSIIPDYNARVAC